MTSIEWTRGDDGSKGKTWNPTTGCDRVSPGCDHCYAMTMAKRLKGMGQPKYQRDGDPRTSGPGFGLAVHRDSLSLPLTWRKPHRVFVNSMSDLFHDDVPSAFIAAVFDVMRQTPQHTYQILTKRHARLRSLARGAAFGEGWPLPNVWLGVSVEDQKWADIRIPALLDTPAAVRFLSCEPLLGPLRLSVDLMVGMACDPPDGIGWVIAGGESGPGARPMHPSWPRMIRDDCQAAGIPFFFKQWGEFAPARRDEAWQVGTEFWPVWRYGKKAAGRVLDGRTWDEFPAGARSAAA